MHLLRAHRLVAIQLHQVILNLLFTYTGRGFTPPTPTQRIRDLREVGSLTVSEDWDKELIDYFTLLISVSPFLLITGATLSLAFSFLTYVLMESLLVIPSSLAKSCSSFALAVLTPFLGMWTVSLYSPQVTCLCFHWHCISFLLLSLRRKSMSVSGLLCLIFYTLEEHSCTLRKGTLKSCQHWSSPLSLRTVSKWILFTKSLKSWKFTLVKFRGLTLLLSRLTLLKIRDLKIWAWEDLRVKKGKNKAKTFGDFIWALRNVEMCRTFPGCDALGGEESRECKTHLRLIKEPVQKLFMEVDPPLMLWADYRVVSHQFPRFLERKAGHTHWMALHSMPRALTSVYQNRPCPFLSPLPLLCLHSIKALHFPGRKSFGLVFGILKLNFTFFNAPALSNM